MKIHKIQAFIIFLCCFLSGIGSTFAQSQNNNDIAGTDFSKRLENILKQYTDTLDMLRQKVILSSVNSEDNILTDPFYISVFSSPTLFEGTLRRSFAQPYGNSRFTPTNEGLWTPLSKQSTILQTDRLLLNTYTTQPWLIVNNEKQKESGKGIKYDIKTPKNMGVELTKKIKDQKAESTIPTEDTPEWNIEVKKPNFWTLSANFSLQFMQNYISDNWYKGGESNNAMLGELIVELNYNNKQKVTFNNKLEVKTGFQTSHSDSLHKFKTNTDLVRLTNKLGIQATKHWYYTFMLQSWTQSFRGYKSNNPKVFNDFMSPFESVASVGMDYKLDTKKFKFNATISPLACDFKYVARSALETSYGLDEGHHSKFDFGSTITMNAAWNVTKDISWTSRLYFFTNYKKTQVEWENTINLSINRYLSTKLFLFPRFDDGTKKADDASYFQFKENLSVGLNLNF